jgi:hypothetical protein
MKTHFVAQKPGMKSVLALLLKASPVFLVVLGTKVAISQPLNQITSCVEVPVALVDASRRRASSRSDCNPQAAFDRARRASQVSCRDALGPICQDEISAAEAAEVCRAASGSVPTALGTSLSAKPFARPGGAPVDSQLPIAQPARKLCVVLRDLPGETVASTRPAGVEHGFCIFNGNKVTTQRVAARARCGVQCFDVRQHQFRIQRFTTADLDDEEADRILADATAVLKASDGSEDTACSVTLSREGVVTQFDQGDGSVDSFNELVQMMNLPGHVAVVNAINFCREIQPDVIGCAFIGSFVVERYTQRLEGILWAHEFGHNKGLEHRDDENAIMNPTIDDDRRMVTSAECMAYRSLEMAPIASASAASHSQVSHSQVTAPHPADGPPGDIKQFVRRKFIEGVPYEKASRYPPDVVPSLLEMLKERSEAPHWSNIVVVLGMIGDERAIDPIIAFIERDRGKISAVHYRAKTSSIMSLGYLLNKTGDRRALYYLTSGLEPKVWSERAGVNLAPYQSTTTERNDDLAKYAILGLALSGHPGAEQALRALQTPTEDEEQRKFRDQVSDLVAESLQEHQRIFRGGLSDYYRSK